MDTSILCTNGALVVCLTIGFGAGSISSLVDPRFDSFVAGSMVRLLGAVIGTAAGLVLDHFFGPWC
jgi:uncharacterized membrane protein YccC